MATIVMNPYLHFSDNAEEALNFYKNIFGGEVEISRFSDLPGMPVAENQKNLAMHGVLKSEAVQLMASDALPTGGVKNGENISLSLSGNDEATLTKYFEGLSAGGNVTDPMSKKPWGDTFGMVTDKFGIHWMVNIQAAKN